MSVREIVERWANGEETDWEKIIAGIEEDLNSNDDELKKELSKSPGLILVEFLDAADGNNEGAMSALSMVHYALMQRSQLRIIGLLEELKARPLMRGIDFVKGGDFVIGKKETWPGNEIVADKLDEILGKATGVKDDDQGVICHHCNHAYTVSTDDPDTRCPGCGL